MQLLGVQTALSAFLLKQADEIQDLVTLSEVERCSMLQKQVSTEFTTTKVGAQPDGVASSITVFQHPR